MGNARAPARRLGTANLNEMAVSRRRKLVKTARACVPESATSVTARVFRSDVFDTAGSSSQTPAMRQRREKL